MKSSETSSTERSADKYHFGERVYEILDGTRTPLRVLGQCKRTGRIPETYTFNMNILVVIRNA